MGTEPYAPDEVANRVVITGATSLIGHFLLPRLTQAGYEVHALSRRPHDDRATRLAAGVRWHQVNDSLENTIPGLVPARTLIHLAPLWLLPDWLETSALRVGRRVIAFSSTSRFSKARSGEADERHLAQRLALAEDQVITISNARDLAWTLFRPTLIYGAGMDGNVSVIARIIKRFGFFPIAGEGKGLRQPIHADDLARICIAVLDQSRAHSQAINVTGAETFSYRVMVETIFHAMGKPPRILSLPPSVFKLMVSVMRFAPRFRYLNSEMVERMNSDLCFDSTPDQGDSEATLSALGFSPAHRFREGVGAMIRDCCL